MGSLGVVLVLVASYLFGRIHFVVMGTAAAHPGDLHLGNTYWYCYRPEAADGQQYVLVEEDIGPLGHEGTVQHKQPVQNVLARPGQLAPSVCLRPRPVVAAGCLVLAIC